VASQALPYEIIPLYAMKELQVAFSHQQYHDTSSKRHVVRWERAHYANYKMKDKRIHIMKISQFETDLGGTHGRLQGRI